jgi:hypothetical protein
MTPEPAWKAYERQIFERLKAGAAADAEVSFDEDGTQRLPGRFSGIDRQIDVVVRGRFAGLNGEYLMVVDCKCIKERIDVTQVETFGGLVQDVGAPLALMVTTQGYSDAAVARAKAFSAMLLDVVELDQLALWLPRRPAVGITSGASTATLSFWDEGQLVTEVVEPELAERIVEEYRRDEGQPDTRE